MSEGIVRHVKKGIVRHSRQTWARLVAEFEQSGESEEAFCRQRGILPARLSHWRSKLCDSPGSKHLGQFIDLNTLVGTGSAQKDVLRAEVELGDGIVLRVYR